MKPSAQLVMYNEMVMSMRIGRHNNADVLSKPLYLAAIIEAIECKQLTSNAISLDNAFLRMRFGQLYELYHGNRKGFELSLFLRPYYHLSSAPFYHLEWSDSEEHPLCNTPSGKYLREHLVCARLDDGLWDLLQEAENRNYLERNIVNRFLIKT